jgi:ATP-binding cassette subfamily C (CFTR/MRP) protein 1
VRLNVGRLLILSIAFIAVTFKLSGSMNIAQKNWIVEKQKRLRVTSALLDDIKTIKMQGLSQVMARVIDDLRQGEIKISEWFRKLLVVMLLLCKLCIVASEKSEGVWLIRP